jgi:hypothetical protein
MIEHYSETWMGAIIALLSGGSLQQQCAAIPAVSSMAGALQERFTRFYAPLLPSFLSILASSTGPEARSLRGPAMECISWQEHLHLLVGLLLYFLIILVSETQHG